MNNEDLYDRVYEEIKSAEPQRAIAAEIGARIDDTTHLQVQIKQVWACIITLFTILIIFVLVAATGCAHDNKPKCTWVCVDPTNIPQSCACAEEMLAP